MAVREVAVREPIEMGHHSSSSTLNSQVPIYCWVKIKLFGKSHTLAVC